MRYSEFDIHGVTCFYDSVDKKYFTYFYGKRIESSDRAYFTAEVNRLNPALFI